MTDDQETQPVFPLPNVVLFPKAILSLHVFEPRYRLMMEEVIQGGQSICLALLKPGWEADYYGAPDVYPVACVGRVASYQELPDGRYNVTLQGEYKVAIDGFEREQPFRVARIRRVAEDEAWIARDTTPGASKELLEMFRRFHEGKGAALDLAATFGAPMGADAIVNTIAMNLNVEPAVKQHLLEMESTELRYRAVYQVLREASATQDTLD
ncbi:MAG: LON peptidase substrate-binding domain-containing protein, partial [Candidatus Eiseniibacteriota bacterium]